jgi:hypothetical protein
LAALAEVVALGLAASTFAVDLVILLDLLRQQKIKPLIVQRARSRSCQTANELVCPTPDRDQAWRVGSGGGRAEVPASREQAGPAPKVGHPGMKAKGQMLMLDSFCFSLLPSYFILPPCSSPPSSTAPSKENHENIKRYPEF